MILSGSKFSDRNFCKDGNTGSDINKEQSFENNVKHNFKGDNGCD